MEIIPVWLSGTVVVFKAAVAEFFIASPMVGSPAFGAEYYIVVLEKIAFANRALLPFKF